MDVPLNNLSKGLTLEALREAVSDAREAKEAYDRALAARDQCIRDALRYVSSPQVEAITGLGRETISRIKHRRSEGAGA